MPRCRLNAKAPAAQLLRGLALALALAPAGAARAQEAQPPAAAPAAPAPETDPKVQAAIQRAVDKAKDELRDEMRAELQGAQSAAEFMGTVAGQPKLQLLELDGYYRVRWQLLNNLNLRNATDAAGWYDFPKPLHGGNTLTGANMRLRLEPTINASEMVRVRMQVDVLDNYALGSNASTGTDAAGSPYPLPFYGDTRSYTTGDNTNDRPLIIPRRVWGEVQTPVGLLSFGRMPSSWGLGILANAGTGLDQDFGDTVDRIQFALPPVGTPLGELVFVPILDFDIAGVQSTDPHGGMGTGQPLDADPKNHGYTYALKIARVDTDEELRRKQERGERSVNYGLYYNYRTQSYLYPAWLDQGYCGYSQASCNTQGGQNLFQDPATGQPIYNRRSASGHFLSLWARWLGQRWRFEGELVGLYGSVGNGNAGVPSYKVNSGTVGSGVAAHLSMRQWGYLLQAELKQSSRLSFALELAAASGDSAPGMGNLPNRGVNVNGQSDLSVLPNYGSVDGPQWGRPGDTNIDNFRFNPAYTTDLILYRRILGQVTDSWYLRPSLRWHIIPGLTLDTSALYAQAMFAESTPSSSSQDSASQNSPLSRKGARPLGLELDNRLTLAPTTGFVGWVDLGLFQPLAAFGSGASLATVLELGLAAKF